MGRSVIEMYTWFDGRDLSRREVYPTRIFNTENPDEMFESKNCQGDTEKYRS